MSIYRLVDENIKYRIPQVVADDATTPPAETSNTLDKVTKYIPGEVMAIYIPVSTAILATKSEIAFRVLLLAFGLVTFGIVFIVYLGKNKGHMRQAIRRIKKWPWWALVTATTSYYAWALSLPNNTFFDPTIQLVVSTVGMVIVSIIFPFLETQLRPPAN